MVGPTGLHWLTTDLPAACNMLTTSDLEQASMSMACKLDGLPKYGWCSGLLSALAYAGVFLATDAAAAPPDNSPARNSPTHESPRYERLAQQTKTAPSTGAAPPATAAQPQAAPQVAAWSVSCTDRTADAKLSCEMTQSVIEAQSQTQLLLLSVKPTSAGGGTALLIRAFHGVYIPSGLTVRVDKGNPTPLAFQKSDQLGLYAALPLSSALVTDLKRGKEITITLELNKGEPLNIVALLTGFGQSYDKILAMR